MKHIAVDMMVLMLRFLLLFILFFPGISYAVINIENINDEEGVPFYHWVQFARGSTLVARVITEQHAACPDISVDGKKVTTTERVNRFYKDAFPVKICQAFFDADAHKVSFADGTSIVIPRTTDTIGIMGDSGCRDSGQNCFDTASYPGPLVSKSLAGHKEADFIIHIGDITYNHGVDDGRRERKEGDTSRRPPYGDNWAVAEFEFFRPFRDVLMSKPMLIVRGNHESCRRGGGIWSVLFDTTSQHVVRCADTMSSYFVDIADTRFLILDSTELTMTRDIVKGCGKMPTFVRNMEIVREGILSSKKENILLTHRPFVSIVGAGYTSWGDDDTVSSCGFNEQGSMLRDLMHTAGLMDASLSMVISGHQHNSVLTSFKESAMPLQVIVGNSGAELYKVLYRNPEEVIGCPIYGSVIVRVSNFYYTNMYGFALLERTAGADKKITFYNARDEVVKVCDITGRQFLCK